MATGKGKERKESALLDGQPIIITGGSLSLEYADETTTNSDGFDDDGSTAGVRKKLKHKKNTGDKVELTRLVIVDKGDEDTILMRINLRDLSITKKCRIKIFYELKP